MGSVMLYRARASPYDENKQSYPMDRSPPESTRTTPSAAPQEGGVKYATGASSKIRGRDNITTGTRNTRTLRAAGKLQELQMKWTGTNRTSLDSVK